jgi:hypothetical protein
MASAAQIDVRPRTTGEILDDAWRLYLADVPSLLALSSLFTFPLCVTLLCLLTLAPEAPIRQHWLWPALAALALLVSGVGSGACQEFFRHAAEGTRPTIAQCIVPALKQAGNHAAARGLIAACSLLGSWLLLLPGLAVVMSAVAVHPILVAGEKNLFAALRVSGQQAQRQPVKTGAVILSRFPLLLLGVLNLYLLVRVGLWTAEHLAGLDVALAGLVLSAGNPVYITALLMLAWLLLAPYFEAANYLLHADARARYEGLDLWYRVRRFFPLSQQSRAGVFLLALGSVWFAPVRASANDDRLTAVQHARREIQSISSEISKAEPYPGSAHWNARLKSVAGVLDPRSSLDRGRYRWFHQAIENFGHRGRDAALKVLTDLDQRLNLIEESLRQTAQAAAEGQERLSNEELKKLLPGQSDANLPEDRQSRPSKKRQREKKVERRVEDEEPDADGPARARPRGPGVVTPHPQGGFSSLGWLIVGGIFVAILIVALIQGLQGRKRKPSNPVVQQAGQLTPSLETILTNPNEYSVTGLWREADELARAGRLREAVRTLYLAVLALLHRANLIRFERTRTNGEYVRQLRSRDDLRMPFSGMTNLFELKWYSESACETADYHACRVLAEEIRNEVSGQ